MSKQESLFDYEYEFYDGHPRARRTDPRTSHEAAASAVSLASEHRSIILRTLRTAGIALAVEEIASCCGLTPWQIGRRMSELERSGDIVRTTETHVNSSGRHAFRYKATTTAS